MIETSIVESGLVVRITIKEASLKVAERFKQSLIDLLDTNHHMLVIDFEKVTYVDSSFLGALVSSLKYALSKQSDIVLANLQKDIYGLFELIRLDKVFAIYPTLESALSHKQRTFD
jgi:anti-sigma B factor antagonist